MQWYDIRGLFILWVVYRDRLWRQFKFFAEGFQPVHYEIGCGQSFLHLRLCLWYARLRGWPLPNRLFLIDPALPPDLHHFRVQGINATAYNCTLDTFLSLMAWMPDNCWNASANIANAVHCMTDTPEGVARLVGRLPFRGRIRLNALGEPTGWSAGLARRLNQWAQRKRMLHALLPKGWHDAVAYHAWNYRRRSVMSWPHGNGTYVEVR